MKVHNPYKIIILLLCVALTSCKINQTKNGLKTGKWIQNEKFMNTESITTGRYKKGDKKGIWKEFLSDRLLSKEKYKKNNCHIIKYHNTGKVQQIGVSKKTVIDSKVEWLPTGEWKFYDSEGVLLGTKIYEKGIPVQEIYTK
jgi:antitoxin component YwqK of YwqJK toxin-antitoxin module